MRCAVLVVWVGHVAFGLISGPRAPPPRAAPRTKAATATVTSTSYLDSLDSCELSDFTAAVCHDEAPPFAKVMAANRAEIAVRIMSGGRRPVAGTTGRAAREERRS